ncbi:MAG TPA: hypothetical protein VL131_08905 [Gammaproteobacteria bacterium]|nr:hypothetical protein [Gammaproteobacteria bacterium]
MNDEFLHGLRQDPPAAFARRLKSRLNALEAPAASERRSPAWRWLATAASVAALGFAFTLPAVRSAAEAFLDYFRVVNFAGVAFDPQRTQQLWENASIDLPALIGKGPVSITVPSAPPVAYSTLEEASAAAGTRLHLPTWLPQGFAQTGIEVGGAHEFSVTADTSKLQTVLDALGITDVTIPAGLDGQVVSVAIPPVARILYDDGGRRLTLVQSRSPVVSFPAGVDLASLAEIGLRLLGFERAEAYRFAQTVDWRSTLLVPVPVTAARFHQVEVQGGTGLVIETDNVNPLIAPDQQPQSGTGVMAPAGGPRRGGSVVLWSSADTVYALLGPLPAADVLQMAESVQ